MKISDVFHGEVRIVDVKPVNEADFGQRIPVRSEVTLHFSEATNSFVLSLGDKAWSVEGTNDQQTSILLVLRDRNLPRLVWTAAMRPKQGTTEVISLQVHEFPAHHYWPDPVDIGVDEKVVDYVRQKQDRLTSVGDVVGWLADRALLPVPGSSGESRVLFSGSPSPLADDRAAFRLHGHRIAVDVARGTDNRLTVTRVVEARRSDPDARRPILLLRAALRFCDATIAGQFRGTARSQLDQLVEQAGSYLNVWKEYNALERESVLRRARALGWLRYSSRRALNEGRWRFVLEGGDKFDAALAFLRDAEDLDLEAATSPPLELQGSGISEPPTDTSAKNRKKARIFAGSFAAFDANRRTLDIQPPVETEDVEPPPEGFVFVSLGGDRKRLERRQRAQAAIAAAACPMPQLGLLIEGVQVPERRRRTEEPLSAAARAIFGGEPTARQIEALRLALNTPDIALIQGPPGTGKTRTIAALEVRLAELTESSGNLAGQTLLTSYQHDAVENAAAGTLVFGLPAIKVGRKRGQLEEEDGFDRWRRERVEGVRADLAELPEWPATEVLRRVRNLATAYVAAPANLAEAKRVLATVSDLATPHLPPSLLDRLLALKQELKRSRTDATIDTEDNLQLALRAVRGLRCEPISFGDDGPRNALRAQRRLEPQGLLEPPELKLLETAAAWDSAAAPPFLGALKELQGILIDRLTPDKRPAGAPQLHGDVEAVLAEVVDALYRKVRQSAAGEDAVLYDYLNDLESDVDGVRDAVRDYTVVLAATCQQAVGHQMCQVKGLGGAGQTSTLDGLFRDDNSLVFTNVIVDEAARANPLDLFIPMAHAERRIILVGDHRQLPHILEPDIEAQLEQSVSEGTRAALKRSLFERLFRTMRAREAVDRIKRTVTLDVQYRMHPVLGDFVSDTFYKPYGEAFSSGRPAEDFPHDLDSYRGCVAAWVNIPLAAGREKGGQSKRRTAEAHWLAKEVQRLAGQRPDLNFGVITFYAAQVDEILQAMEPLGLSERLDDGRFRVSGHWRETRDATGHLKERLRVGTVDAFQGKEFDVVLLSMTRSNDLPADNERALRRKYGHLMLENRLCVAMSRQQRLLIVVGDEAMLRGETAEGAVPGLIAFRKLCGGPHGRCLSA